MMKDDTKGISKPPFAMGEHRYFEFETLAINFPPRCKKKVRALNISLGTCPTTSAIYLPFDFIFHTTGYGSCISAVLLSSFSA